MARHVVVHEAAGDSGMGFFMGIVVLILAVLAFWYWGMPVVRNTGTQINVPDEIDVNVNQNGGTDGGDGGTQY